MGIGNRHNVAGPINPQHGGTVIPISGTGTRYPIRGVRQNWTPTLAGTTTTGAATYTFHVGTYWYDGSEMNLTFNISATSISGFVGALSIQGLPATATNGGTNQNTSCVISQAAGFTLDSGYTTIGAENVPGGPPSQFLMLESGGAVNTQPLPISTVGSAIVLQGQCTVAVGQ